MGLTGQTAYRQCYCRAYRQLSKDERIIERAGLLVGQRVTIKHPLFRLFRDRRGFRLRINSRSLPLGCKYEMAHNQEDRL